MGSRSGFRFTPLAASLCAVSLGLLLGACSPDADREAVTPPPPSPPTGAHASASPPVIGLDGLDDLRIDEPVPANTSWAERGAQVGDACRTVSSPAYPGVYAMVVNGKVQRITVGKRSEVKLAEGVGAGATEKEVKQWFAGFEATPHKYEAAPAKYLTAPNAANGSSALRFEIGQDARVSFIHVGTMPVLAYVEGCA